MAEALVLGGAGHLGAGIVRALCAAGHDVRATGRRPGPRIALAGTGARYDADEGAALSDGAALIVDAATPYPLAAHGPRDATERALARTARVIAAARRHGARLIHVSSFTTLPPAGGLTHALKRAAITGAHPYFPLKQAVERAVLGALGDGLPGTVINPCACLGPFDTRAPDQCLIPMLAKGRLQALADRVINVMDVRDVGAAVARLAQAERPPGQVPLTGPAVAIPDLAAQICALAGTPPPRVTGPASLGAAGLWWTETALAAMGRATPWPSLPALLVAVAEAREESPRQRALGLSLTPLSETLTDALDWHRQIGHLPPGDSPRPQTPGGVRR